MRILENVRHEKVVQFGDELKVFECENDLIDLSNDDIILVRLDGVKVTHKFKTKEELFSKDLEIIMMNVLKDIRLRLHFITFAYSYKDEFTFILKKDRLSISPYNAKKFKIETIISGYVSSLFSLHANKILNLNNVVPYSFDCRIISIPPRFLWNYFFSRQYFSIDSFNFRVRSYMDQKFYCDEKHILKYVEKKSDLSKYYYSFHRLGYIGYIKDKKWTVEVCKDLRTHYQEYDNSLLSSIKSKKIEPVTK